MFKKLKRWLIYKGYIKLKTHLEKIEFITTMDIDFYNEIYRNVRLDFIEKDIIHYNRSLDMILRQGLESTFVSVKDITQNSYFYTSFSLWCSDDGRILDDIKEVNTFFKNIKAFLSWYERADKVKDNTVMLNNVRRLKPYYYNLTVIIDLILEQEIKK